MRLQIAKKIAQSKNANSRVHLPESFLTAIKRKIICAWQLKTHAEKLNNYNDCYHMVNHVSHFSPPTQTQLLCLKKFLGE